MNRIQDQIRGSLVGGAIGDALGYPVEFLPEDDIFRRYGPQGITAYDISREGMAVLSDDTQMTLFTAAGLLFGMRRQKNRGISGDPRLYISHAYLGWLHTQEHSYSPALQPDRDFPTCAELMRIRELFVCRAPGNTCLSALRIRREQERSVSDFIAHGLNSSKGCGGVMRVAPLGLALHFWDAERAALEGAQVAAITHSHPLGYLSAGALVYILHRILYSPAPLKEIIFDAAHGLKRLFGHSNGVRAMELILKKAVSLSENSLDDLTNIHSLGGGWVGEEALAISLYCCLRYTDDFSKAVTVSVNHKGDSDSTGAITGNIMGALFGYSRIPSQWKEDLQLQDLLLQQADSLYLEFR